MSTQSKPGDGQARIGILGLGIMGSAIAQNLLKAGQKVVGYDPDPVRHAEAREMGVDVRPGTAEVIAGSGIVLLSLPDAQALDDSVSAIVDSPTELDADCILVELSTLDLDCKKRARDRLAEVGLTMLDCPISGTGAQAVAGDIAIYASGDADAYEVSLPVFNDFARSVHYLGEFGSGTKMKFVANLLVAIHNVATAEALVLGTSCGLDPDVLCEVIGAGAGSSRIFELRSSLMTTGVYDPPTMKLDVWQKDLALIGDFAERVGAPTPLFSATSPLYLTAIENGLGQQDTAAVCTVLQDMANPVPENE